MKFTKLYMMAGIVAVGLAYVTLSSNSGGITGQSIAGCSGGGCHGAQNTNTVISLSGTPITGYSPNTAYLVTVTVTNPNYSQAASDKAGINLLVSSGSLSGLPAGTTLNGTKEFRHTTPQPLTGSSASWVFTWTSPAAGTGPVIFNYSCNVVNGDNNSTGDAWNKGAFTVTEGIPPAPIIVSKNATVLTNSTVDVTASINPNGNTVSPSVEYGLTTSYGSNANMSPATLTGTTPTSTSGLISSLTPGTTYHYRVKATYSGGNPVYSADGTFKTWGLGINYIANSSVKVYPNPSQSQLNVSGVDQLGKVKQVTVMNVMGQTTMLSTQHAASNMTLDISNIAPGNYLLNIATDKGNYVQQFVKQ